VAGLFLCENHARSRILLPSNLEDPGCREGPKGEKRPADAIGKAAMIAKIATGEIEDITIEDGNAAAVVLECMGGKACADGMTANKRSELAKKAAKSRWKDAAARAPTKS
jgi:hypothetical protein